MKWKAFFVLMASYVFGVASCFYLAATLAHQEHVIGQFLLWTLAGAICVPLFLLQFFDQ